MSIDGKIMRRARARLDERRRESADELSRRTEEVYRRVPKLERIDRDLRTTMLDAVTLTLRGAPQKAISELQEKNLSLQEERARTLVEYCYPVDYLDEHPSCPKCRDTGLMPDGTMCRCLRSIYRDEQQKELSSLLKLGVETFDTFSLDWYSAERGPGDPVIPRNAMDLVYEACLRYAQSFGSSSRSLLLTGGPGLGKTFLSTCIAKVVSENGFSVVYDTSCSVFAKYEELHFGRCADPEAARDDIRRYESCDLLILDDLGTEMCTAFTVSSLYSLVNGRLASGKKTIISTNLSTDDILRRYSSQVHSRIAGEYQVLRFYGTDIRLLKQSRR